MEPPGQCTGGSSRWPAGYRVTGMGWCKPERGTMHDELWEGQNKALGAFIRAQRELARLSLRQLSEMTDVSNAYLSQIERGLHEPSIRVIRSVAKALGVPPEVLLYQAGLIAYDTGEDPDPSPPVADGPATADQAPWPSTEDVIRADPRLGEAERDALLSVYRSYTAGRG
jgi:transcriptional regulator with XRE-family HTH domain